jgi:hypothetical protein
MFGAMARCMDNTQSSYAEPQFVSVFEIFVGIFDVCLLVNIDFGACAAVNLSMA